jgi:dipeptidyl aminopeptidase/acylaminoacyl peptidase
MRIRASRLTAGLILGVVLPLASLAAADPAPAAAPGPIPVEEIFRPQAVNEARLSPDGKHLGAVSSDKDDVRSLLVLDLATGKPEVVKDARGLDVGTFRWINDHDLVFTDGYDQRYGFKLFSAKVGSLERFVLFNAYDLTKIVGLPRARPNRALVWIVSSGRAGEPTDRLVEMSTEVAAFTKGSRLPRSAVVKTFTPPKAGLPVGWLALDNGELGYCLTYADRKNTLHRYDAAQDAWTAIDLDGDRYRAVDSDPDLHTLWVSHYEAEKGFQLQRYDPVAKILGDPVWADPSYDLSRSTLHFSRKTGQLVAVSYDQRRRFTKCFQEPFISAQKLVQKNYPEASVHLLNFSDDDTKLLFQVQGPQDPGRTLLLDLGRNSLEVLSETAPWLRGKALQPMYPMSYKTADGLKEEGYLTLPAGASATHKVPLVVLVHDGPWTRNEWAFDAEVQFLASRGYAVLQPNYRGSTGYQPALSFDARFEFKKMQEDVTAATKAATAMDMIDPARVGILGAGFGGFLAMGGAALEPDLYASAVSIGGTFDWEQFVREMSYYPETRANYEQLRDFLGKPGKDRDTFADYSPLKRSAAIKVPVFLAFSEDPNDSSTDQAKDLAAALKKQGTPCETFKLTSGYYDLRALASRYELYRKIDGFLAAHLHPGN